MARKFNDYKRGTAEAKVQTAITERFGSDNMAFFRAAAARLGIRADSVKGAWHRAARGDGAVPDKHQPVYVDLLDVSPALIARVGKPKPRRKPKDRPAAVEDALAELRLRFDAFVGATVVRLDKLEAAQEKRARQ